MESVWTATLRKLRLPGTVGMAGIVAGLIHAPAQALLPPAALVVTLGCPGPGLAQAPMASPLPYASESKAAAILGGQPSALDLINLRQSGAAPAPAQGAGDQAYAGARATALLCPPGMTGVEPRPFQPLVTGPKPDDFLGSARASIGRTPFDAAWQRVSAKSAAVGRIAGLAGARGGSDRAALETVNRWVNQTVQFTDDATLYGRRDYWASASETLKSGKGDCEDYAILKYQILLDMGFAPDRMYLTLARDKIRNREHAVLIVKSEGRFYLLDNAMDSVAIADGSHDYSARMSFSGSSAWVHGYTVPQQPAYPRLASLTAHFSERAVSSARVTGLSR